MTIARRFAVAGPLLAVLAVLVIPAAALAQSATYFDRNNNTSVLQRPRPDYAALGLNVGGFQIFPTLTVAGEFNDNILATQHGRESDFITTATPNISIQSNWSRNQIGFTASDRSNFYASHGLENTNDYNFAASGRLDVFENSNFSAGASYSHSSLGRTSELTLASTSSPVQFDQISANFGGLQTLNRVRFSEGFSFNRIAYANAVDFSGAPVPLSQDNNSQFVASARVDFAMSPSIAIFASGQYNDRLYNHAPTAVLSRNSSGYEVTTGADFDLTRLVRGQVQIGYFSQAYTSSLFHTVSGPTVHAKLEYFLSGLTTITLFADRNVIDDANATAVSFLQTNGGIEIDHELLRNLILSGKASYETDVFTGIQRRDQVVSASIRGTYFMNRHVGVTLGYTLGDRQSTGVARAGSYLVDVVSLSLVFQL